VKQSSVSFTVCVFVRATGAASGADIRSDFFGSTFGPGELPISTHVRLTAVVDRPQADNGSYRRTVSRTLLLVAAKNPRALLDVA